MHIRKEQNIFTNQDPTNFLISVTNCRMYKI